jgi:hypothetical protein
MSEQEAHNGQWPGPPAPAERKADEARENVADAGTPAPGTTTREGTDTGTPAPGTTLDEGAPDEPAALLAPAHSAEFQRRWDAIKASFVDDPRDAVRRAEELANEVVTELTSAVDARRRELAERREGADAQDDGDKTRTERLRVVLHGYQRVLDPVLKF